MESNRFDRLARSVTQASSRRGLLTRLSALPLGAALATLLGEEEGKAGRRKRRRSRRRQRASRKPGDRKRKKRQRDKKRPNQRPPMDDGGCDGRLRAANCDAGGGTWTCDFQSHLHLIDLSGCNLPGAGMVSVDFNRADLSGTVFNGADLSESDFSQSDMTGATLQNAEMVNTVLGRARLQGADFSGAFLLGAVFGGSDLSTVIWNNTTCPDGTNSNAHGNTCIGHLEAANVVE